jgi:hypothetical protein
MPAISIMTTQITRIIVLFLTISPLQFENPSILSFTAAALSAPADAPSRTKKLTPAGGPLTSRFRPGYPQTA